ncbi:MAG: translation initiation factor IF-2 [Chitinophagales bacterium]|nr:translation initiation factor IF-2 [Chitinophagales bacterium]
MSEDIKLLRLPVVAKEFNVSVNTIIDHLKDKGFNGINPATKVTPEMYDVLRVAFQKDAEIKSKAEQISLSKGNREDVVIDTKKPAARREEEEEIINIKTTSVSRPVVEKPAERPPVKKEEPAPAPAPAPTPEPVAEVPQAKAETTAPKLEGPKVMGKIDLSPKPKPAPSKPETKEEKVAPKETATAPAAPPKEEPKPVVEEKTETTQPPVAAEEEFFRRTEKQTLSGPKLVGRIELPVKQDKPAAKPEEDAGGAGGERRKRKRLVRPERITLKDQPDQQRPQGGGQGGGFNRPGGGGGPRGGGGHNRPGQRPPVTEQKTEVTEKEIQEKIKNTLAKLGGGGGSKGKAKAKLKRQRREDMAAAEEAAEGGGNILQVTEFVSVSELASLMNVSPTEVISKCMQLGIIVSINQRLDAEVIELVASEFDYEVQFQNVSEDEEELKDDDDNPEDLVERAPIVTVMGHVDHGKTSLLDHIRSANVAAKEAGGITQHIGAYEVTTDDGRKVVFLDTPGHEAFTAMRARGAKVTDVAVIVIAADDQVMPQTREAISHAQAAGVPMIFAINKIDKDGANPDKIREQLANMNLLVEEWGGKFQSQEISAKKGTNIDKLLDKILLEAELLELKANPDKPARGTVLEASLDKGRGFVATVLVSGGTLRNGDIMVAGVNYGKIKAMFNEKGQKVKEAGPATAVLILGLDGAPQAGEIFKVYESDSDAKQVANKRQQILREQGLRTKKHITLDEIGRRLALGTFKELNVIIKGDFDGSVEALKDSLLKLSTPEVQVGVVHSGVGQITESDVLLASASDAVIIGFQVRPSVNARKLAEKENIEIRMYSIIYDAIDEVKTAMEGLLEPKIEETITGYAEVREVFKITKVGTIAGCVVTEGRVLRTCKLRVIREGIVVHSGEMASLKRFKDDVKDVIMGQDCGISIKNYNDIQVGDTLEAYTEKEVKRKL